MKICNIIFVALTVCVLLSTADGSEGAPEWSSWKLYGKSCKGKCDKHTIKYKRKCIGGRTGDCGGEKWKMEECQDLPPCATWGPWKADGKCSSKCGVGQQQFKRKCIRLKFGKKCKGDKQKFERCNLGPCASWSKWEDGECSVSCGDGTMTQRRECQTGIGKCIGQNKRKSACNQGLCDMDECDSNPCKHNGKCIDGKKSYTCECQEGWNGDNCEKDIDECAPNGGLGPCKNSATCSNTKGSYTCNCASGWKGTNCDEDIDECAINAAGDGPCKNSATCSNTKGSYTCNCASGWKGTNCDEVSCDDGIQFEGDCYVYIPEPVENIDKARARCASLDGSYHLAYIKKPQLQQALFEYLGPTVTEVEANRMFALGGTYEPYSDPDRLVTWFDGEQQLIDWLYPGPGYPKWPQQHNSKRIVLLRVCGDPCWWNAAYEGIINFAPIFNSYQFFPLCQSGQPYEMADGECMVDGRKGIEVSGFSGQENTYFCIYPKYGEISLYSFQEGSEPQADPCNEKLAHIKDKAMQLKIMDFLREDILFDVHVKTYKGYTVQVHPDTASFWLGGTYARGTGNTLQWNLHCNENWICNANGTRTQHGEDEFVPGYPVEKPLEELMLTVHKSKESKMQGYAQYFGSYDLLGVLCMKNLGTR